jgi:predicted lipoprotein with Yx(FWY)xxD motif
MCLLLEWEKPVKNSTCAIYFFFKDLQPGDGQGDGVRLHRPHSHKAYHIFKLNIK